MPQIVRMQVITIIATVNCILSLLEVIELLMEIYELDNSKIHAWLFI